MERARERGRASANWWLARQALAFAIRVLPARVLAGRESLDSIAADARVSARALLRMPAFTLSFTLTLTMAIGVFATVYAAANWVLLRPVPGVRSADGLVTMRLGVAGRRESHGSLGVSQPDLVTLQQRMRPLVRWAAMTPFAVDVEAGQAPARRVPAEMVTANYFKLLGARLLAGGGLAESAATGAPPGTVLSYELARTLVENPASIVGVTIRVNNTPLAVVGVTEPGFHGAEIPGRALLWLSASAVSTVDPMAEADARSDRSFGMWQRLIGRLSGTASPNQVESAANAVIEAVRRNFAQNSYGSTFFSFQVFAGVGLDPDVRLAARHTLTLLMGAAAFLLCLALANLTNLALTHAIARSGGMAIRIALGATKLRLARSVLIEVLTLSLCGGGLAVLLVTMLAHWFAAMQLSEFGASLRGMQIDERVVVVVLVTAFVVTLLAFLQPAVLAGHGRFGAGRRSRPATSGHRLRFSLVALQVAISVALLVAALLLARTVWNLHDVDLGFPPEHLLTIQADPQLHGYHAARLDGLAKSLVAQVRGAPGVAAVGIVTPAPLQSAYTIFWLQRHAGDTERHQDVTGAGYYVTPGFLQALGVRLLAGDRRWRADSGTVVITRQMLRQLDPRLSPAAAVGLTVYGPHNVPLRIAAVVGDVRLSDLTKAPPPTAFLPLTSSPLDEPLSIYVRSAASSTDTFAALHHAMEELAPNVPLYAARSARDVVDLQFAAQQVMAMVAAALGILGIALAAVGLYGVLGNLVAAGEREIAIRGALGAGPRAIAQYVLWYAFVPVAVGLIAGAGGAVAISRLLASSLFGVRPLDPASYGWGVVATAVIALSASLPPAYRATRVSVVRLLHAE